jgi:hypothetical protein
MIIMRRFIKEPLVHFLVAGGLLFAVYGWLNREGSDEPRVVRITAAEVSWLKEIWARQWQRPPSDQEVRGIVADFLKEVLLAREARELGLDENDPIIRRRLAQKMEFLVRDTALLAEPGDDELHRLYDTNRERYQIRARISFTQLYFKTETAALRGLDELTTINADELGDPSLLARDHVRADAQTVANLFGRDFADKAFALAPGRWHGPVASAYGFHLVKIGERQAAQPRPFDEVRANVLGDWHRDQSISANERFFAMLLKKYDVVMDESIKPSLAALVEPVR